jgi:tetratricopeptide (TPR) repeat protein
MLAEVGPAGVAFLALALGVPVLAAVRARRRRLVPFAFGAYVVLLAHAAVDWDWELPAVTLLAVLCAAALLLAARLERGPPVLSLSGRTALASMSVLLALVAGVGLIGNSALDRMADKLEDGDASAARAQAEKAERWAPWSSEPLYWLGYLDQVQGDRTGARGHYRDAVDRDPNVWELWLTLAQVSRGEERRHALERAAELNPLGAALPSRLRQERRDASS